MSGDSLLDALASFAVAAPERLDPPVEHAAKHVLIDSLAVALGALEHPAAHIARRYAHHSPATDGATLWGSGQRVGAEAAALANGVPLRGYDYNDLYIGKSGGHPSDMVPGAIALAEWRALPGRRLLAALALGYDVALELFDTLDLDAAGWDYPNVTAIAGTCAFAQLLGLDEKQTREALAITLIPHFASDEVESGDLNTRGDLTMWKRFNGADAGRQSVYACLLAEAGAEGAVRPFEGRSGFLSKLGMTGADVQPLVARLTLGRPLGRMGQVTFKRWPVGSRAQSAIQAALEARRAIDDVSRVRSVRVECDEQVYQHLVRRRADPWHPVSRETADHSLPYIVAAAIIEGEVRADSFEPARVTDPGRRQFLQKVTCEPSRELSQDGSHDFLARVEIVDGKGRRVTGEAKAPSGHPARPFTDGDFEAKFRDNVAPLFGGARTDAILRALWNVDGAADVRDFCALLVAERSLPAKQQPNGERGQRQAPASG